MAVSRKKHYSRLYAALDRVLALLPPRQSVDWTKETAAHWRADVFGGSFERITELPSIDLDDLLEIDRQKDELVTNTRQFCMGLPANNALLWGARGTGKSSLIQAILNRFAPQGL